jgi:DNA-binding NtrC family response regulator
MVRRGEFRADLFYRLHVLPIRLPSLRERAEDIESLVEVLLEDIARRGGLAPKTLSAAALRALTARPWPGNVRELRNALEQAFLMSDEAQLEPRHFGLRDPGLPMPCALGAEPPHAIAMPGRLAGATEATAARGWPGSGPDLPALHARTEDAALMPASTPATLPARKAELERAAIAQALHRTKGNRMAAARLLAISRATLYEKLAKYPELASG